MRGTQCLVWTAAGSLLVALSLNSCGQASSDSDGQGGDPSAGGGGSNPTGFLSGDRTGAPPDKLSDLGLFSEGALGGKLHPTAARYEPRYPLWSNGSTKERFVSLPAGSEVDTTHEPWQYPIGTVFVKTFAFAGAKHPVETRISVLTEEGAKFYAYEWDKNGEDATLLDGRRITRVDVEWNNTEFSHEIPSNLQCRACHESARSPVLGFDALRLSLPLHDQDEPQLEKLTELGVFESTPAAPPAPSPDDYDPLTLSALEYFEGNCVHCHNGSDGPSSAFDLRFQVALDNLIGVETSSELLRGLRVDPGSLQSSALYQALLADPTVPDTQAMPPVGVQNKDTAAISLIEEWIQSLEH